MESSGTVCCFTWYNWKESSSSSMKCSPSTPAADAHRRQDEPSQGSCILTDRRGQCFFFCVEVFSAQRLDAFVSSYFFGKGIITLLGRSELTRNRSSCSRTDFLCVQVPSLSGVVTFVATTRDLGLSGSCRSIATKKWQVQPGYGTDPAYW